MVESGAELNTEVERVDLHITEKDIDMERAQHTALKDPTEDGKGVSEQLGENKAVTEGVNSENTKPRRQCSTGPCDDMTGVDFEQRPLRKGTTSDSLEEYMEECCRLSEVKISPAHLLFTHNLLASPRAACKPKDIPNVLYSVLCSNHKVLFMGKLFLTQSDAIVLL